MKERPILFTPENAQKCHDGIKTQTRRIVKPELFMGYGSNEIQESSVSPEGFTNNYGMFFGWECPYGVVGDRLWVREAWAFPGEEALMYRGNPEDSALYQKWMDGENYPKIKWTPSLHMPRWACRTVLEITEIRVERLQDITADDIRAEVVKAVWPELDEPESAGGRCVTEAELLRSEWIKLWESINGPGSWDLNPWVWVIGFRRIAREKGTGG